MGKDKNDKPCPRCGGTGTVWVTKSTGPDYKTTCPKCGGTGKAK